VQRNCASQQRSFDAFRAECNTERPHEALQQEAPASRYTVSPRTYLSKLPIPEYPLHYLVKKVTDAGVWSIYFNTALFATLDERDYIIRA
jgi:hypothetical protein